MGSSNSKRASQLMPEAKIQFRCHPMIGRRICSAHRTSVQPIIARHLRCRAIIGWTLVRDYPLDAGLMSEKIRRPIIGWPLKVFVTQV